MISSARPKSRMIGSSLLLLAILLALLAANRLFATGQGSKISQTSKNACIEMVAAPQETPPLDKTYLPLVQSCPGIPATATPTPNPWTDPAAAIEVFSPVEGGVYNSPIEVIGYSRTFEASVMMRLLDSQGTLIAERYAMGGSVDGYDFFHTHLRFFVSEVQTGTLQIFEEDAENGGAAYTVTIPLTLGTRQRHIDVDWPKPGDAQICTPMIGGYSETFEANVVVTLSDRNGTSVAAPTPTEGGNLGFYRPFSASVPYTVTVPTTLLIGAHETSPMDGSDVDYTRIPISLYPCP
ncbi:MAG: hypothetical protein KF893_09765 [Caldilineaceae bacterium]|nr:hypothetical protein [Caldilineaceae bacterium]